mgnify:CR=1 FL=1
MDEDIQKRILELEEATKNNSGLNFQIAINYGSVMRWFVQSGSLQRIV